MPTIAIIGSGFAGLTAACKLAKEGHEVHVFEKNEDLGGRARKFEAEGYTFDMGPSWYWMPEIFEQFYSLFGYTTSDFYQLQRISPSYNVVFEDEVVEVPSDWNELKQMFDKLEPGSAERLEAFMKEAKTKYDIGMGEFVRKPSLSVTEFMTTSVMKNSMKLDLLQSFSKHVRKYFSHPKLISLVEFPVLFLGAKPADTPALYSLMNYADMKLGTWYPMGGMNQIVQAIVSIARELGVHFHTSTEVLKVEVADGKVVSLQLSNGSFTPDYVVSAADYHHTETKMLDASHRTYDHNYWEGRTMAPSSILYYLGLDKKVPNLHHHNLFFDADFDTHVQAIYDDPQLPEKPLFYVCVPSKTDPSVAPKNCENLFILIPTAAGLEAQNEQEVHDRYLEIVAQRIEKQTNLNILEHISFRRSFSAKDFVSDYHSFRGNAYGLANTLKQTAFFKPSMKSKKVSNLYFAGQLTVPGPGVPPSIISGELAGQLVHEQTLLSP